MKKNQNKLKTNPDCGIMDIPDGDISKLALAIVPGAAVRCLRCSSLLLKTTEKTRAKNLPVFCRHCKVLLEVNILPLEPKRP